MVTTYIFCFKAAFLHLPRFVSPNCTDLPTSCHICHCWAAPEAATSWCWSTPTPDPSPSTASPQTHTPNEYPTTTYCLAWDPLIIKVMPNWLPRYVEKEAEDSCLTLVGRRRHSLRMLTLQEVLAKAPPCFPNTHHHVHRPCVDPCPAPVLHQTNIYCLNAYVYYL